MEPNFTGDKNIRVLWLDDESHSLDNVEELLLSSGRIDLSWAQSISEAFDFIGHSEFDVVIVDAIIPLGDEAELSPALQKIITEKTASFGTGFIDALFSNEARNILEKHYSKVPGIILCSGFPMKVVSNFRSNSYPIAVLGKQELYMNPGKMLDTILQIYMKGGPDLQVLYSTECGADNLAQPKPLQYDGNIALPQSHLPRNVANILHSQLHFLKAMSSMVDDIFPFYQGGIPLDIISINSMKSGEQVTYLSGELHHYLKSIKEEIVLKSQERGLSAKFIDKLFGSQNMLLKYKTDSTPQYQTKIVKYLRDIQQVANDAISQHQPLPKQKLKELRKKARDLERSICQYQTYTLSIYLLELEQRTQLLMSYLSSGTVANDGKAEIYNLDEIMKNACDQMKLFSQRYGIEIRTSSEKRKIMIKGVPHDMQRAIENIINNGIKYSHYMQNNDEVPWVEVKLTAFTNSVEVAIENWGEPIEADEIKNNKLIQELYRGKNSSYLNRPGIGIGLSDSYLVINQHGGELKITSRPSTLHSTHHINTFTIVLPRHTN